MSLQEKLDAFKADFEKNQAPAAAVRVMHKATADLIASGKAAQALRAGDRAPSFVLPDEDGKLVRSAELLARGPLVITFYRGVWCPYCNIDLQAIEEVAAQIRQAGATLVAISPQTPANSRKMKDVHALSFPILSDKGNAVADAFGLTFRLPDDLIDVYKGFGLDLGVVNADPSWILPMPARYVVDPHGTIAYSEVNPDYTRRPEPADLLAPLRRLAPRAVA